MDFADEADIDSHVKAVMAVTIAAVGEEENNSYHLNDPAVDEIRKACAMDPTYCKLIEMIEQGFPGKIVQNCVDTSIRHYRKLKSELWTDNGLAMKGCRIIIPKSLRQQSSWWSSHTDE